MKNMKRYIISLYALIGLFALQAQDKGHYLDFHIGGGYQTLQYDLDNGTSDGALGFSGNLGYSYFFTSRWGITTGLGIQSFASEGKINYMSAFDAVDSDGESYEHRNYYNNWQEKQTALFLDIPVGLSHLVKLNDNWKMRGTLGAKLSLAMSSKYESSGGNIETRGYYERLEAELFGMPNHNFITVTSVPDDDYEFDPVYALYAEFGALYKLEENMDLYMGLYASYGLNSAVDNQTKEVYELDGTYNGLLTSSECSEVIPLSVGVKVGITWRCTKNSEVEIQAPVIPEKKPEPKEEIKPVEEPEMVEEAPLVEAPVVEPEPEIEAVPVEEPVVKEEPEDILEALEMPVIRFKFGTDSIEGDPKEAIVKALADRLIANEASSLKLIGHTDNKGARSVNVRVGLKRANTIKQKLINLGVSESKITVSSKAFDEPLVPNTTEENRAKNRRVEFILEE